MDDTKGLMSDIDLKMAITALEEKKGRTSTGVSSKRSNHFIISGGPGYRMHQRTSLYQKLLGNGIYARSR